MPKGSLSFGIFSFNSLWCAESGEIEKVLRVEGVEPANPNEGIGSSRPCSQLRRTAALNAANAFGATTKEWDL